MSDRWSKSWLIHSTSRSQPTGGLLCSTEGQLVTLGRVFLSQDGPDRRDRPVRPDRPDRPVRPERLDRFDRPERPERPEILLGCDEENIPKARKGKKRMGARDRRPTMTDTMVATRVRVRKTTAAASRRGRKRAGRAGARPRRRGSSEASLAPSATTSTLSTSGHTEHK